MLTVFFSSRISPFTSTVILRDRSPLATAVVTAAMLRTCVVRLPAMPLTESVRSFHVPRHALDAGLAAELAFGADLAGHAGHFRRERPQLIDHRVDGVLQFEELALHIDGDLARQVAVGDGRRHLGDVAHLGGQVAGHAVDGVGEVLPRPGDALHLGLAAELAFGADFAGHARHFRRERAELIDHRVDGLGGAQELALERAVVDLEGHRLGEVALGHGADDAGGFDGRVNEVVDEVVDRLERLAPEARGRRRARAAG